jgi:hypothetical protein
MDLPQVVTNVTFQSWTWLGHVVAAARSIPKDPLLLATGAAIAGLLGALIYGAYSARQAASARQQVHSLTADLEELQAAYESELRWRMASERAAKTPPTGSKEPAAQKAAASPS